MPQISSRTKPFSESVIRNMSRIAKRTGAVNLSQGFPDFDPPLELTRALAEAARLGPHQYSVTWGAADFRHALAKKQRRFTGLSIDADREVTVTCGSTEAMMAAMMAVTDPGDRVVIFSPFYENYTADTILCGAEPIFVALQPPYFTFDEKVLRRAFEKRPKALILCNPANPTGKVFTRSELLCIASLAEEFDAFVITDEVYEHIVYTPYEHTYFSALPGMFERTISCSSLSKTYSITGWRLGYVIAPEVVTCAVRKVHDFLTVGAAAPLQRAAVTALTLPDEYYHRLQQTYSEKRTLFCNALEKAELTFSTPQGAYYVLVDISEFGCADNMVFCEWMAAEVGVAAVPGSSFFREPVHRYIRLHFAKKEATLTDAAMRLLKLHEKAHKQFGVR